MPTNEELEALLLYPAEGISREYKSWLDLGQNHGRATLAKAAIALANTGGGIIVVGMREDNEQGGQPQSEPRPTELARYSLDDVNNSIARYADPEFHCDLRWVVHPQTAAEHAFVLVPGDLGVPVMSARTCEGVIQQQRCYIRKPGPRSEEPHTAQEWRDLIERCVTSRRESLLEAIRIIVQGVPSTTEGTLQNLGPPEVVAPMKATSAVVANNPPALVGFVAEAERRWENLVAGLPPQDPARMPAGSLALAFEMPEVPPASSLRELQSRLHSAGEVRHTGWAPFISLNREPYGENAVAGRIEAWLGNPDGDRASRTPEQCDFWLADLEGRCFLKRGFAEDDIDHVPPGTIFDPVLPIWRVGETMLYASRLAMLFEPNAQVNFQAHYRGLSGRELRAIRSPRYFSEGRTCRDDEALLETRTSVSSIVNNLVEVVHQFLMPLYERFHFFEMPIQVVSQELEAMRRVRM